MQEKHFDELDYLLVYKPELMQCVRKLKMVNHLGWTLSLTK